MGSKSKQNMLQSSRGSSEASSGPVALWLSPFPEMLAAQLGTEKLSTEGDGLPSSCMLHG